MRLFTKTYQVRPNTVGYLFRNNVFEEKFSSGVYKVRDFTNSTILYCLPANEQLIQILNQEVLSKDNVALRFSFILIYKIVDGDKFLNRFLGNSSMLTDANIFINLTAQAYVRNIITAYDSEELNSKRNDLNTINTDEVNEQLKDCGVAVESIKIKDLTFPKSVQNLFAKQLEAKIRAKTELENACTAVATARTLKNASELIKGDDNIKFFQLLETFTKIAEKGKHTFMLGDINQMIKSS